MRPFPRSSFAAALMLSLAVAIAPESHAQGTGRSMDIDVSIRSAAMGGASNAVFWGDGLNHWGNPALLGYQRGLRYEWGRTQLVPGLADNVFLTSKLVKAGWNGAGVVFSGAPLGDGGVHLDYGTSEGTDPNGNPTGTFSSYEQVDSWGFGVSALRLIESIAGAAGSDAMSLSRYVDLSGGMNFKEVEIALAPAVLGGVGKTKARDAGGMLRVTPIDYLEHGELLPMRVDLSYGYSQLSYNDDAVVAFINEDVVSRVTRHRRNGFAAHVALNAPEMRSLMSERSALGSLARGFSPLISVGAAFDRAKIDAGAGTFEYETRGNGYEVTLANVVSYRTGNYEDRAGEIDGSTSGWSVGLPLGEWAGGHYEQATFPQAQNSGLRDLTRKAFSIWVDPVAIWQSLNAEKKGRMAARE